MAYKLIYNSDVKKSDLTKIDNKNKSMIKRAIEDNASFLIQFKLWFGFT